MPGLTDEQIIAAIGKLIKSLKNPPMYRYGNVTVCACGHLTNCTTCQSRDDQDRFERLSEIGR